MSITFSRREALGLGAAALVITTTGLPAGPALAASEKSQEMINAFTGGVTPEAGKIKIDAPEIAENGNTVPVGFSVESAMEGDDMVTSVMVLADGNPSPDIATFNFSALSGAAAASTRIRLAKTQDVIVIAKMSNGSVYSAASTVKVTIGGCGG